MEWCILTGDWVLAVYITVLVNVTGDWVLLLYTNVVLALLLVVQVAVYSGE